jgi:diguanylate cyclase
MTVSPPPKTVHWVVRMNYQNRAASWLMVFAVLAAHFTHRGYGAPVWGLMALQFLVYPQLAYWRARSSAQPLEAEITNLLLDNLLFGVWIAALGFPLWIAHILSISGIINMAAFRGRRGALLALVAQAAGALLGVVVGGLQFLPQTDLLTSALAMVTLSIYLLMFAYAAHARTLKLHETRDKLHASEQALQQQLSAVHALQSQLSEQANRDPLTGLYNRRYLTTTMERELQRCQREGQPLSLLLIDLDHFKRINDTYGHTAGDETLRALAQLLNEEARASDVVCRYGGEEFLLLLPGMPQDTALQRAEHCRTRLQDMVLRFGEFEIRSTLSIGVATYPGHGQSARELIHAADHALYRAKTEGRNRVVVFDPADTEAVHSGLA